MPNQSEPQSALIDAGAAGNNTLVAAEPAKKIRVISFIAVGAGAVNAAFQSGAGGTALTGAMPFAANTTLVAPDNPNGWFETAAGTLLNLSLSAAVGVRGCLKYVLVE